MKSVFYQPPAYRETGEYCWGSERNAHPRDSVAAGGTGIRTRGHRRHRYRLFGMTLLILALMSGNRCLAQSTLSLLSDYLPARPAVAKLHPRTLGVQFWSAQAGTVSAITFYRGAVSREGYVATLYAADGTVLASVTMSQESGPVPGWQQAVLPTPVPIAANTTYVAAYYAPHGRWASTPHGLDQTLSNGPLNAPAASLVGGNGLHSRGLVFPTSSTNAANYFVDVAFTPDAPYLSIAVNPTSPTIPNTTGPGAYIAQVAVTWSDGSPFTGTLSFGPPNYDGGGVYALDSNNNLIVNPSGPGVGAAGGSVQNVTLVATQ